MATQSNRPSLFSTDNLVQLTGLLFAIVVIALAYNWIIRPRAAEIESENRSLAARQTTEAFVPKRDFFVIIKDYEQQICFTLMVWATIMISYKFYQIRQENQVLWEDFLDIEKGERIIPEEALIHSQTLQEKLHELPQFADTTLLPRIVRTALHRLHSTRSIQDVSQAVRELAESEADRLDSDLSLVRYIAWAIPSVGFIGTVRGIGEALTKADQAIKGDVSGVTSSLGLAFNSTFVALLLSIVLMFLIHLLQNRQENLILEIEEYCREKLIAVMKIPFTEQRCGCWWSSASYRPPKPATATSPTPRRRLPKPPTVKRPPAAADLRAGGPARLRLGAGQRLKRQGRKPVQ